MNYLRDFVARGTPQSEPIPGTSQVPNSAGGYTWAIDKWTSFERFLILGSEGGTYYINQRKLTVENVSAVLECINEDGPRAVWEIVEISSSGRAPKNDPAIFALALAASSKDPFTRKAAAKALPSVCRIGTHLFTFATFVENMGGWGHGRNSPSRDGNDRHSAVTAVAAWYTTERTLHNKSKEDLYDPAAWLAYQAVKYRQRAGWTHKDLLRLSHPVPPTPEHDALFEWIVGKNDSPTFLPAVVRAHEQAQAATTSKDIVDIIHRYPDLPREAIPDNLQDAKVWEALLYADMPMTALIRNLANMSRVGLLKPLSDASNIVCSQITDQERLTGARVHPLAVLVALTTYKAGYSDRSGQQWPVVPAVVDALDAAFYMAFGNVEKTGRHYMLAIDVSGSMGWSQIAGMPGITPRIGAAAMALVTAAVEPNCLITAFSHGMVEVDITPRQRLDDVIRTISKLPMGGTDCALPMRAALGSRLDVDSFVIYTDSEQWAGDWSSGHPIEALNSYRSAMNIPAKMVTVGMVSNGFTLSDPNDLGMMDVVGFDTATPNLISDFSK